MANHPGWPAELTAGAVTLRPPRLRDARVWSEIRMRNQRWLEPWEPSSPLPWDERNSSSAWPSLHSAFKKSARAGMMLPFMIMYGQRLAGQVTVSNIVHGIQRSCTLGYWVDGALAGRNIVPTAVALTIDHCFREVYLHRVQIDIRPENRASLRVVEKLALRQEAYFQRYLDIDGDWRDHVGFAVTVEEMHGASLLSRLTHYPVPPAAA